MKKILVTDEFIKNSKTFAEDILGYNECFGNRNSDINKLLKKHIKKCNELIAKFEQ